MEVIIRKEEKKDFNNVFELNRLAFQQDNESKLVEKIRIGENFVPELSLVAEINGEVVGHILFSKIQIISKSTFESLALAPMAVHPKFQKQGIGGELVKKGLSEAKRLGFDSVILVGHEDYYPKFGFQKASKWNIKCPFEVPDGAFMGIELTENAFENKAGTVKFPVEFMDG